MAHTEGLCSIPYPSYSVKHSKSLPVCPNVVLPILALVGIGLICCLIPQVQQWIAHTITRIETGQMTLGNAIVLIGVPAISGTLLITGIVLLIKKHQRRSYETFHEGCFRDVINTLKACFSKKNWVIGALTIASLVIGGLVIGYLQPFQPILAQPIKIWQGLALGVGSALVTGLALAILHTCGKSHRTPEDTILSTIQADEDSAQDNDSFFRELRSRNYFI